MARELTRTGQVRAAGLSVVVMSAVNDGITFDDAAPLAAIQRLLRSDHVPVSFLIIRLIERHDLQHDQSAELR